MGIKINILTFVAIIIALIIIVVLYLLMRDSPGNNLRRARKHHKLGQRFYEKGDYEEAKLHYEAAKRYRERAIK